MTRRMNAISISNTQISKTISGSHSAARAATQSASTFFNSGLLGKSMNLSVLPTMAKVSRKIMALKKRPKANKLS